MGPIIAALVFLLETVLGAYILLVMLRFLLQWLRVSVRGDPVVQVIWRLTNPPLRFLYNFIPGWRSIDIAAIVLMLGLMMLEISLTRWLYSFVMPMQSLVGLPGIFILSIAHLLSLAIYIFIFAVIIQAILSWVGRDHYNPLSGILNPLTEVVLRPVRYRFPPMQGMDFSPMIVVIGLMAINILLVGLLQSLAR